MARLAKFIALYSFRAGTRRSSLAANLAALSAVQGGRVAVIDTCLRAGDLGAVFGFDEEVVPCSSCNFGHM